VLLRQSAYFAVHPFDRDQDDEVARAVGCDCFLIEGAGLEEPRERFLVLARRVKAVYGLAPEWRHEREVVRMLDEREVSIDVAANQRRVRVCCPLCQRSNFLVRGGDWCTATGVRGRADRKPDCWKESWSHDVALQSVQGQRPTSGRR
jgi:hypothetical protein